LVADIQDAPKKSHYGGSPSSAAPWCTRQLRLGATEQGQQLGGFLLNHGQRMRTSQTGLRLNGDPVGPRQNLFLRNGCEGAVTLFSEKAGELNIRAVEPKAGCSKFCKDGVGDVFKAQCGGFRYCRYKAAVSSVESDMSSARIA
jgi:hypothetical protein